MADYGFQIFKNDGSLNFDHNTMLSRWLGSGNIPAHRVTVNKTFEWKNIPFNGGTPFAYAVPDHNVQSPAGKLWMYVMPDIEVGPNWVRASYPLGAISYPDDTAGEPWTGNCTVHWGVYNG